MADRSVSAMVAALEQHRIITARLLTVLDALVEDGGPPAQHLVDPCRSLLREEDQALEPLVHQLARH